MRERTARIAALNVKVHPHPENAYVNMFSRAKKKRVVAKMRGNRFGMVATFSALRGEGVYTGVLNTFVDFDPSAPWLNTSTGEAADEEAMGDVNLPKHLKPDLQSISFVLMPEEHRLFFEITQHSNANSVRLLVSNLLSDRAVRANAESSVEVHVEQDIDTLERIFALQQLRHLEIVVSPPNSDDLSDLNDEIEAELTEMSAREMKLSYESVHGKGLQPNERTKQLARLATSNGEVSGRGLNASGKVESITTASSPMVHRETALASEAEDHVLLRGARAMMELIREKFSKNTKNT